MGVGEREGSNGDPVFVFQQAGWSRPLALLHITLTREHLKTISDQINPFHRKYLSLPFQLSVLSLTLLKWFSIDGNFASLCRRDIWKCLNVCYN